MKIIITQQQFNVIVESKSKNIDCEKCDHSWKIEPKDKHPFLCHDCGYDNKSKKYNKKELDKFWNEYESGDVTEKWSEKYKNTLDFSSDFKTLFVEFEPSVRFNEFSSPFNTAKKFYLCISF